eukprot:SAG31_NODE_20166_length_582_cov_0.608696_1_plen_80_part_10
MPGSQSSSDEETHRSWSSEEESSIVDFGTNSPSATNKTHQIDFPQGDDQTQWGHSGVVGVPLPPEEGAEFDYVYDNVGRR